MCVGLFSREEEEEILSGEGGWVCGGLEVGVGEALFVLLQFEYLFLDGVPCDELVGEDGLGLSDAVGAVDGLGFGGGVPFLLLGLLLYAFRARREIQLGAYVLFSLGVYLLPALQSGCSVSLLLWGYYQWMMVFAVLPLACYNGVRGSAPRWLFYVFYPAHIYLLWALGALL